MTGPGARLAGWCLSEGYLHRDPEALISGFVAEARACGVPIDRLMVTLRTLHPQLSAVGLFWEEGCPFIERRYRRSGRQEEPYQASPVKPILEGQRDRIRVDLCAPERECFPVTVELFERGFTDYLAAALLSGDGAPNILSIATRRPGGFTEVQLAVFDASLLALRAVMDRHAVSMIAENICSTYLGEQTGRRVLQGNIERGDVERLRAAIWFSDIRGFTARSQALGVTGTVALLNDYFELIGEAVEAEGGEILKFIGDASLVVFPCVRGDGEACDRALAAAQRAQAAASSALGVASGIGLHIGEVAYGNIGARDRLDFTIVGTTVNLAARLEDLCSVTGEPVLASAAFASAVGCCFDHLGDFALKGLTGATPAYRLSAR